MKPITEKMTKPANILVALLVHVTINVSLKRKKKTRSHITLMQYMQGEVLYTVQGSLSRAHTCCGNADEGTVLHLSGMSDADQR